MKRNTKLVVFVMMVIGVLVLAACPAKKTDVFQLASTNGVALEQIGTPFEPTNTPVPTRTPTPTLVILPWKSPTPTLTRTPYPTRTPNRDCGFHIYCTPTPVGQTS